MLYKALHAVGFRELLRRAYRIEVEGGEHIPATGPCILVSNHDSLADPFFLGVAT
ncbi:MAG: 1-acyl-sn-glycerol-3-phosphate acyltransferase, partial [Actinobacteria bacterium]|nr:1-acyl-sn-glycerol-3-phosphate acyltransferase [Actinomycetota bacterium]